MRNKYFLHFCSTLANKTDSVRIHYIQHIQTLLIRISHINCSYPNSNQVHTHDKLKYLCTLHSLQVHLYKLNSFQVIKLLELMSPLHLKQ